MSKPVKSPVPQSKPKDPDEPKPLGISGIYQIKKYGLYRYQVVRHEPQNQKEIKIGEANVYAVVASDLVDLIFHDINPENR